MTPQRDLLAALDSPRRMRRFLLWSLAAHAALLLAVLAIPRPDAGVIKLTEIAFLEPGEAEAAATAPSGGGALPAGLPAPAARAEEDVRFEREPQHAEMSPRPQSAAATGDQMSARLSQLQDIAATRLATSAPSSMSSAAWGPAGAGGAGTGGSAAGISLRRGGSAGGCDAVVDQPDVGGRGGSGRSRPGQPLVGVRRIRADRHLEHRPAPCAAARAAAITRRRPQHGVRPSDSSRRGKPACATLVRVQR